MGGKFRTIAAAIALLALGCSGSGNDGTSAPGPVGGATATGGSGGQQSSDAGGSSGGVVSSGGSAGASAAGAPGTSGAAGAAGAPGAGLLPTPADTLTEACIVYVVAQKKRQSECYQQPTSMTKILDATKGCPDLLFDPGSTRTLESVLACAKDWETFSCDSILQGLGPSCRTPGTRAPGDTCIDPAQCASLFCGYDTTGPCGTCDRLATLGQDCTGTGVVCADGTSCTNGVCANVTPVPPQPPIKAVGETCRYFSECQVDLGCMDDGQGVYRCTPLPKIGDPCTPAGGYCASEAWCDLAARLCRALPGAGEPCGVDFGPSDPRWCADGLTCDVPTRLCLKLLLPGEACPVTNAMCHPGSQCQNGICEPIASQGLFVASCGMP